MDIRNRNRLIKEYAGDILHSSLFQRSFSQRHHYRTSVGKHSLQTARMGLWLCTFLKRRGIAIDERRLVRIALLHDMGMLGRKHRYRNNLECGYMHPKNSADIARKIWPDIDRKSLKAIRSHMWPLSLAVPTSREAAVLCMADKMAAVSDLILSGKKMPPPGR